MLLFLGYVHGGIFIALELFTYTIHLLHGGPKLSGWKVVHVPPPLLLVGPDGLLL